jgi:hypothetical protein
MFVIDMYEDLRKKRWSDRKSLPLEEQLNDIVVGIRAAAAVRRAAELRRQEEARRRAEEQRRREEVARIQAEEEKRQAALEREVELWTASNNILSFLEACEETIKERFASIQPDSREAKWSLWSRAYANRLNPLKNGRLREPLTTGT